MLRDNPFSFIKGLLLGVIAGGVAGVLLAPKSGVETREDIKKFAKDTSEKAVDEYEKAKRMLNKKIQNLKEAGDIIDEEKYKTLVNQVLREFKRDYKVTATVAEKLGEQLSSDWSLVKTQISK